MQRWGAAGTRGMQQRGGGAGLQHRTEGVIPHRLGCRGALSDDNGVIPHLHPPPQDLLGTVLRHVIVLPANNPGTSCEGAGADTAGSPRAQAKSAFI